MTQNLDKMLGNPKKIDMFDISFSNLIFFLILLTNLDVVHDNIFVTNRHLCLLPMCERCNLCPQM